MASVGWSCVCVCFFFWKYGSLLFRVPTIREYPDNLQILTAYDELKISKFFSNTFFLSLPEIKQSFVLKMKMKFKSVIEVKFLTMKENNLIVPVFYVDKRVLLNCLNFIFKCFAHQRDSQFVFFFASKWKNFGKMCVRFFFCSRKLARGKFVTSGILLETPPATDKTGGNKNSR